MSSLLEILYLSVMRLEIINLFIQKSYQILFPVFVFLKINFSQNKNNEIKGSEKSRTRKKISG
jgi:hypothetical protein